MTQGTAWRRRRFHLVRFLGNVLLLLGAAAVIGSLAVDEARGIPGWEPVSDAALAVLAAEGAQGAAESKAASGEYPPAATGDMQASPAADSPGGAAEAGNGAAASDISGFSPLLDLNAATAAELEDLPGIGPAKAQAIVAFRESVGPFRSVDDLLKVKGIGPKLLEQIRPFVRAGPSGGPS